MTHIELFQRIDQYFLRRESLLRIQSFIDSQHQLEDWYKGELILLFKFLKEENQIINWQSEYRANEIGRGRIDFFVSLEDGDLALELKAFYHGIQRNSNISIQTCFTSLPKDIGKLSNVNHTNKFSIIFVTPKPNYERWQRAFQAFSQRFQNVTEESNPNNYPENVYIAKLRVD